MSVDKQKICASCPERRGNRCRLANQTVSVMARTPSSECPLGRWPGSMQKPQIRIRGKPASRTIYPEAEPRQIQNLAAVTCHYNPCGYKLLEDNYYRFAAALPTELELWTIELAYGDAPFRLPDGPRMLRVRGDSRHVLWQKERMLNLAIEALPADVDAVA